MWWDSSISIDRHIISLMPFLSPSQIINYNITADKLEEICSQSMKYLDIQCLVGALHLIILKGKFKHNDKQITINYLKHLNRLFSLVSNRMVSRQKQSYLRWYMRLIFINWLKVTNQENADKLINELKNFIHIFQKCWAFQDESRLISRFLVQFQNFFFDRNINKNSKQSQQLFNQHGSSIIKNKRLITFVYLIYELIFLYLKQTYKLQYYDLPTRIFDQLMATLYKISEINRLSFAIQSMSYVLRKFLIVLLKLPLQKTNDVRQTIIAFRAKQDTIFSEQQRCQFNAFHMKPNKYFDYLQIVLDQDSLISIQKINYWKNSIRLSMQKSVKQFYRAVKQSDIDQVVFYLQIRKKQDYLYGDSQQINDFPDIKSKVVKKIIQSGELSYLQTSDQFCAMFILKLFNQKEKKQYFNQFNLFQRGLLLYYLAYFQAIRHMQDIPDLKTINKKQRQLQIDYAFQNLYDNQDFMKLLDFYLFQIRLGNYHNVQQPKNKKKINKVYNILYERLVQTTFMRIKNTLIEYKQIKSTLQLKNLVTMTSYFSILVKALTKQDQTIYVCQYCKIRISHLQCPFCESILIGIKLVTNRNQYNHRIQLQDCRSMIEQLRQIVEELILELEQLNSKFRCQWFAMFLLILERVLQLIGYFDC